MRPRGRSKGWNIDVGDRVAKYRAGERGTVDEIGWTDAGIGHRTAHVNWDGGTATWEMTQTLCLPEQPVVAKRADELVKGDRFWTGTHGVPVTRVWREEEPKPTVRFTLNFGEGEPLTMWRTPACEVEVLPE